MDSPYHQSDFSSARRAFDSAVFRYIEGAAGFLAGHWLFATNAVMALLASVAFVAPALQAAGLAMPARAIYFFYSFMCHQLPYRSYFVFGYQVAQCQRNIAIYASLFAAGIAFAFVRDRLKPLDWRLFATLITPMAIDGGTQLLGWRESNWELRTLTGALFGIACVWLTYPLVERSLRAKQQPKPKRAFQVVVFRKPGCSLCDKAEDVLARLRPDYHMAIEEIDITTDPELMQRYGQLIPVVHVDGRPAAVGKVSEVWLRRLLDGLS